MAGFFHPNTPAEDLMRRQGSCWFWLAGLGILAGSAGLSPAGDDKKDVPGLIAALRGHAEQVYSVAFTPDGKILATGSFDNTIKLWDATTHKEIRTLGGQAGHQKMVLTVAISPDGQLLASGSADNTLKIWDIPSPRPLRTLAHADAILGLSLSPDGKRLALAGMDGAIKVLDAATFKPLLQLPGHVGAVQGLAFSPNGQTLAGAGADRTIRFWNATNGQPLGTIGAHSGPLRGVAIHPNNVLAFSIGEDGLLKFWQIPPQAGKTMANHNAPVRALALSGDGNQVLSGGADNNVRLSNTATGQEIRVFTGAKAPVECVALNSNASQAAAAAADQLFLWNMADGKLIDQLYAHADAVTGISFQPQNQQLLTSGSDGLLRLWALPLVPAKSFTHPEAVPAMAAFADGKQFATGGADKIVRQWDLTKNTVVRQFTGHGSAVTAMAVGANQAIFSGDAHGEIRLWNQATGKESAILGAHAGPVSTLALNPAADRLCSTGNDGMLKMWQFPVVGPRPFLHPDQVTCLALTADGSRLATGCGDKVVRLWNLKTGAKEKDFAGHTLAITAVAVSAQQPWIASSSADKSIRLWNVADGKLLKAMTFPSVPQHVLFLPDGKKLVAAMADGSIRILQLPDGKEGKSLAGHTGAVNALALTSTGDLLISAGADKTVRVWKLADGSSVRKLEHAGPVTALALSKDGQRLAAAADTTVIQWSLNDGKETGRFTTAAAVRGLAFTPDGSRLVVGGADKSARLYSLDGRWLESFAHDGPVLAVACADGKQIVTASADKMARIWTTSLLWHRPVKARSAVFMPRGDQILAADDKSLILLQAADGKEIKTIPAHNGVVLALDVSGDGLRAASAGADKSVKVWDLKEFKPVVTHTFATVPQAVRFSPNGTRLAVAVEDQKKPMIHVYDGTQAQPLQTLAGHAAAITSLAFLADNRSLLSASLDKSVRHDTVAVAKAIAAHPGGVIGVQFHGNGTQALSAGADRTIKLWDLAKGAVLKTIGPLPDAIRAIAYDREYARFAAATGKIIKIWNSADGKDLLSLPHPAEVLSLSFSADKIKLVTGAADKITRVWDLAGGAAMEFFPQEDAVLSVVFDPRNNAVLSAGGKAARLDRLSIQRVIAAGPGPLRALTMTPSGSHVLAGGAGKTVDAWNAGNGNKEKTFAGLGSEVSAVAVSRNNILVAVATIDGTVRLLQWADGKQVGSIKTPGVMQSLAFSPNSLVLAGVGGDKALHTWDVAFTQGQPPPAGFLKPTQVFALEAPATDVVFAPDNFTLFSAGQDKSVRAWKLASAAPVRNFPHPNFVDAVAFNKDGTQLASGGHDGKLRIFDLVKGAQVREINAHPKPNENVIYSVAYSPDGKKIVSASLDNSLKLWDAATGTLVKEFKAYNMKDAPKGHQDPVFCAAFSPDGKFLVSGSAGLERLIKIWNVADGSLVRDLVNPKLGSKGPPHSHPGWVYQVRFTSDGKYLVSAGDAPLNKGYLAIWNFADGTLLHGDTTPLGAVFGLAMSPTDNMLALGAGPRRLGSTENHPAYLLRWPLGQK
jgi:WD40 repeat protein